MKNLRDPSDLLRRIAETGYFQDPAKNRDLLTQLLERKLNVSIPSATEILTSAGLVAYRYSEDLSISPRDQIDHWQFDLTDAGRKLLTSEP